MPPIKRWFPVSQNINTDPEVRRLKRELGLTGFSMWLEILARTDQVNLWKGSAMDIGGVLGGVCNSNTRGSARCLQWVTDIGWIRWQRGSDYRNWWGLEVVNHAIFHGAWEEVKIPRGKFKTSLPSEPSEPSGPKIKNKTPIVPKTGTKIEGFNLFWKEYPKKIGKGAAEKAWLKLNLSNGLCETILEAVRNQKSWPEWVKDSGQFIPHPATWLNQRRWEDELSATKPEGAWGRRLGEP